jgi:hypothetical protein
VVVDNPNEASNDLLDDGEGEGLAGGLDGRIVDDVSKLAQRPGP